MPPRKFPPKYKLSLKLPDKTYTNSAATIVEALEVLNPEHLKSKVIVGVQYGTKYAEVLLWPRMMKKLLVNKIFKELFQKRMILALK